jgi:DNA repair exonuclease SbcCD ATPase subunit
MGLNQAEKQLSLHVENVGGIRQTEIQLDPGVTILSGRNATNRTSLLQALMAALGSDHVSLKGDAEQGCVTLDMGEETYTRTLDRKNGAVVTTGDSYLVDAELADLFAFLLESNEARRAVERGENLRDIIMRPVDTEAIQAEIEELKRERQRLDEQLDNLESLKRELPTLEQQRSELEAEIADLRDRLAEKEAELDDADATVEDTREGKAELEAKLGELRDTRANLESIRFEIETQEESIAALRSERADLEDEREELPEMGTGQLTEITAEIERLRDRKQQLTSEINDLQSTIQFNEEVLADGRAWVEQPADVSDGSVTDQLVADTTTVTCWTCGSEVGRAQIQSTLSQLQERRQEKLDAVAAVEDQLAELVEERDQYQAHEQRQEEISQRLTQVEDEIENRTQRLDDLRADREQVTNTISRLEAEIEELETEDFGDVLSLHKEANKLEFELEQTDADLDDVKSEIADIEQRLEEYDTIQTRREDIQADLEERRTRIERIERQAVESFNEHMDTVLARLEYENLERIWIEQSEQQVRDGRQTTRESVFDLHVVRKTESGATYEDTVDHLSESEREVTGLVFALAGYLVHDVADVLPFMLLDSLEAVDAERIATLIEYLQAHSDYLVVALLEEDAAAVDTPHAQISEI